MPTVKMLTVKLTGVVEFCPLLSCEVARAPDGNSPCFMNEATNEA